MARIKIVLPDLSFSTEIPIRISDVNYGGHVGNDAILTIMHEARMHYLRSLGYENELGIGEQVGLLVADVAISYKAESFYGDELLAQVGTDDFNKYGFDMFYLLLNKTSGKEVARGKTGMVCFNYVNKQLAHTPEEFRAKLEVNG